jgi:transposase
MQVASDGQLVSETQTFGTTTPELLALLDWLLAWGCTHVAIESTGDFWKPVFNILEGEIEVWLVNAQHVKTVKGRKTDVKDSEWLAELLMHGLLKPSFIPPKPQRQLRELTRYRSTLVQERARIVNRVQKLLEEANIKLSSVATDVLGVSGRAILEALVADHLTPEEMAQLARGRLRNKIPELEKALVGLMDATQRRLLALQLEHIDFLDEKIDTLSADISQHLEGMSQPPTEEESQGGGQSSAEQPDSKLLLKPLTWPEAITLLDSIPGVSRRVAEVVLAEIGLNMEQFPTADHLAAWAGLAPGNNQSGGKRRSGGTRKGNRALRSILVEAAWSAIRVRGTFLRARYHRLAGRRGKKRAIVAVAHTMLVSIWHMLSDHKPYHELGGDFLDQRKKDAKVGYYTRQLHKLGYSVHIEPQPAAG